MSQGKARHPGASLLKDLMVWNAGPSKGHASWLTLWPIVPVTKGVGGPAETGEIDYHQPGTPLMGRARTYQTVTIGALHALAQQQESRYLRIRLESGVIVEARLSRHRIVAVHNGRSTGDDSSTCQPANLTPQANE